MRIPAISLRRFLAIIAGIAVAIWVGLVAQRWQQYQELAWHYETAASSRRAAAQVLEEGVAFRAQMIRDFPSARMDPYTRRVIADSESQIAVLHADADRYSEIASRYREEMARPWRSRPIVPGQQSRPPLVP